MNRKKASENYINWLLYREFTSLFCLLFCYLENQIMFSNRTFDLDS